MLRKVLSLQYLEKDLEGEFNFDVNGDKVRVDIKSANLQKCRVLDICFAFPKKPSDGLCYKIEILNADDETVCFSVFCLIEVKYLDYVGLAANIPNFCNLSALIKQNPNLLSRNSEDPMMSMPHIKIAVTFGTKDELIPLSSVTNIDQLSPIQMLRSILNETAFDDPKIEARAIKPLIESSVDRLRGVINVQNAASILRVAQKYNVESLKEVAVIFVTANYREVMETSGWKEMPDHFSKGLLSSILLSLTPRKNVDVKTSTSKRTN